MKKNTFLTITFCAITAFAAGCKPSQENSTAQQLDKVKTETKADAKEMKDFAFAQRAEFVATMQGQLDALNKDMDQLSVKIENSQRCGQERGQTQTPSLARRGRPFEQATR